MPDLNLDTLNCVYFGLLLFGFGYALFIVITGGLSDIDVPNVDIDIPHIDLPGDVDIPGANVHMGGPALDAPDVSLSPLSPITIASFVATFGGVGILANQILDIDPRWGLLLATASGLGVAALMYLFVTQFLYRSQASSELRQGEMLGREAEVTVPIVEGGFGQVSFLTKSGRMSSIARSLDGKPISRGQAVVIVRTVGPQVLVKPVSSEES